jgi:hypothetical protein
MAADRIHNDRLDLCSGYSCNRPREEVPLDNEIFAVIARGVPVPDAPHIPGI